MSASLHLSISPIHALGHIARQGADLHEYIEFYTGKRSLRMDKDQLLLQLIYVIYKSFNIVQERVEIVRLSYDKLFKYKDESTDDIFTFLEYCGALLISIDNLKYENNIYTIPDSTKDFMYNILVNNIIIINYYNYNWLKNFIDLLKCRETITFKLIVERR